MGDGGIRGMGTINDGDNDMRCWLFHCWHYYGKTELVEEHPTSGELMRRHLHKCCKCQKLETGNVTELIRLTSACVIKKPIEETK